MPGPPLRICRRKPPNSAALLARAPAGHGRNGSPHRVCRQCDRADSPRQAIDARQFSPSTVGAAGAVSALSASVIPADCQTRPRTAPATDASTSASAMSGTCNRSPPPGGEVRDERMLKRQRLLFCAFSRKNGAAHEPVPAAPGRSASCPPILSLALPLARSLPPARRRQGARGKRRLTRRARTINCRSEIFSAQPRRGSAPQSGPQSGRIRHD